MNTIIEKIRAEVERQARSIDTGTGDFAEGRRMEQRIILSVLSDLEKEEKPMNPEDAMKELDEKISLVKQRGTWDGVDVDKYMDEVRGREPEKPSEVLEEEYKNYVEDDPVYSKLVNRNAGLSIARHFAQWGAEHLKK